MTKQWDKFRAIIVAEYKDQNKPLREVQRVMMQRYGFRASTRAYRSRFDRWGIYKYSRRRRMRSMSLSRRESISDGDMPPSPRQCSDTEESSSQAATPVVATPNGLFTPGICLATPSASFRSSLCLVKADLAYPPATPSPGPVIAQSPAYPLNQFGSGLAAFNSQNIGCYSASSFPMYRQDLRSVTIVSAGVSGSDQSNISPIAGIPTGYGYTIGLLTGQE